MYCMATLTKNEICAREWKGKRKMHCAHSVCNIQRSWKVRKKLFRKNIYCVYLKWTTVQNENDGETRTRMERATKQKKETVYKFGVFFIFTGKDEELQEKSTPNECEEKKASAHLSKFRSVEIFVLFRLVISEPANFPNVAFSIRIHNAISIYVATASVVSKSIDMYFKCIWFELFIVFPRKSKGMHGIYMTSEYLKTMAIFF